MSIKGWILGEEGFDIVVEVEDAKILDDSPLRGLGGEGSPPLCDGCSAATGGKFLHPDLV